ncbi:unnamed protein product, partial [Choristocarpus tenellus]
KDFSYQLQPSSRIQLRAISHLLVLSPIVNLILWYNADEAPGQDY